MRRQVGAKTEYRNDLPFGVRGKGAFRPGFGTGEHVQDGRANARPASVTAGDLDTGARLGRYVIIERVGSGAMGVVYGAYDPELDRKVALKLLKPGQGVKDTARARLLREAKAMARLPHPNVVAVHDVGVVRRSRSSWRWSSSTAGRSRAGSREAAHVARGPRRVRRAPGAGWRPRTRRGSCTATSSRTTCCSTGTAAPRVVDFGLARQAGGGDDDWRATRGALAMTATLRDSAATSRSGDAHRTGTWSARPRTWRPSRSSASRRRAQPISSASASRSTRRSTASDRSPATTAQLLGNVRRGARPVPENREVPTWIRRAVLRGLKADPAARWPSMAPLIAALEDDPGANRRRLLAGGAARVGPGERGRRGSRSRATAPRRSARSARHVADAALPPDRAAPRRPKCASCGAGRSRRSTRSTGRGRSCGSDARAGSRSDGAYHQAERAYETAFMLDQSRARAPRELADLLYENLLLAGGLAPRRAKRGCWPPSSSVDDDGGQRGRVATTGDADVALAPVAAHRRARALPARSGHRPALPAGRRSRPGVAATLPRRLVSPGGPTPGLTRSAIRSSSERRAREMSTSRSRAPAVPDGFVYVPPGEFWFGDADEDLRTKFLDTVPIHRRHTDAFLIARHETTYSRVDRVPRRAAGRRERALRPPPLRADARLAASGQESAEPGS